MCHTIGFFQDMAKTRPDLSAAYTKISQSEILTKIYEYFAAQRDMNFSEMQDGVLSHSEIVYFLSVHDEEIQKISEWI